MILEGGVDVSLLTSLWINSATTLSALISVSYASTCLPIGPFTEAISIPFLYATTPYPVLQIPLLNEREPSVYMNMTSSSPLYSSYKLVWSSAHSDFTDVPALFSRMYRRIHSWMP